MLGSTDVIVESWALAVSTDVTAIIKVTLIRSEIRCMVDCSIQSYSRHRQEVQLVCFLYFMLINTPQTLLRRQINGKYRKCLLKRQEVDSVNKSK